MVDKAKHIKLETFIFASTGLEGKIRKLIISDLKAHKVETGSHSAEKSFKDNERQQRASWAGHSSTYEKKHYEYFYNINKLFGWFKKNTKISFNRVEENIEHITNDYILQIEKYKDGVK